MYRKTKYTRMALMVAITVVMLNLLPFGITLAEGDIQSGTETAVQATGENQGSIEWNGNTSNGDIDTNGADMPGNGDWGDDNFVAGQDNGTGDESGDGNTGGSTLTMVMFAALAGMIGISVLTGSVLRERTTIIPDGDGIWVPEADREAVVARINSVSGRKYHVDGQGYLAADEVENEAGSDEYSSLIDGMIVSGQRTVLGIDGGWESMEDGDGEHGVISGTGEEGPDMEETVGASIEAARDGLVTGEEIPEGNGIWVPSACREEIAELVNGISSRHYNVDGQGFLRAGEGDEDMSKSGTYSGILDRLIMGDRKVVVGTAAGWMRYDASEGNAGENGFTESDGGVEVGDNRTEQVVIVDPSGMELMDAAGGTVYGGADMVLVHELVHALRGEYGLRSPDSDGGENRDEEAYVIQLENRIRTEAGYGLRGDGDSSDDVDSNGIPDGNNTYGEYEDDGNAQGWYERMSDVGPNGVYSLTGSVYNSAGTTTTKTTTKAPTTTTTKTTTKAPTTTTTKAPTTTTTTTTTRSTTTTTTTTTQAMPPSLGSISISAPGSATVGSSISFSASCANAHHMFMYVRDPNGNTVASLGNGTGTSIGTTITATMAGTYTVQVDARNTANASDYGSQFASSSRSVTATGTTTTTSSTSSTTTTTTTTTQVPHALGNISISTPGTVAQGGTVTVSASCPYADHMQMYIYDPNGNIVANLGNGGGTSISKSITASTMGVYTIKVDARNTPNSTDPGTEFKTLSSSFTVADTVPPTNPGSISSSYTENSISLSWGASSDNVGVTGYNIYNSSGVRIGTASGTSYTVSGLAAGSSYTYTVRAVDAAGNESSGISKTTSIPPLPPALGSVNISAPSYVAAGSTVAISASCANADHMQMYVRDPNGNIVANLGNGSGTSIGTSITAAVSGTYTVQVDARNTPDSNDFGSRFATDTKGFVVDGQMPTNPVNLTGSSTDTSINLSWGAAGDNTGVAGYNIYDGSGNKIGYTGSTSYTVNGLLPVASYTYTVKAVDLAGNESSGASRTVSIPVPAGTVGVRDYLLSHYTTLTGSDIGYSNGYVTVKGVALNISGLIHGGDSRVYARPLDIDNAYANAFPLPPQLGTINISVPSNVIAGSTVTISASCANADHMQMYVRDPNGNIVANVGNLNSGGGSSISTAILAEMSGAYTVQVDARNTPDDSYPGTDFDTKTVTMPCTDAMGSLSVIKTEYNGVRLGITNPCGKSLYVWEDGVFTGSCPLTVDDGIFDLSLNPGKHYKFELYADSRSTPDSVVETDTPGNPELPYNVTGEKGTLAGHEITKTSDGKIYIKAVSGDTLSGISQLICGNAGRYGEIATLNGLVDPNSIKAGWNFNVTGIITQTLLDQIYPPAASDLEQVKQNLYKLGYTNAHTDYEDAVDAFVNEYYEGNYLLNSAYSRLTSDEARISALLDWTQRAMNGELTKGTGNNGGLIGSPTEWYWGEPLFNTPTLYTPHGFYTLGTSVNGWYTGEDGLVHTPYGVIIPGTNGLYNLVDDDTGWYWDNSFNGQPTLHTPYGFYLPGVDLGDGWYLGEDGFIHTPYGIAVLPASGSNDTVTSILQDEASIGNIPLDKIMDVFSFLFDNSSGIIESADSVFGYYANGFWIKKVGNYAIIKGARSQSALSNNIYGTRYLISNTSEFMEVVKYVDASAAVKAAFHSKLAVGTAAAAVIIDTVSDFSTLVSEGASTSEIVAAVVTDILLGGASAAASIAIGAFLGGAIGTLCGSVMGTIAGAIIGAAISEALSALVEGTKTEQFVKDQLTALFDYFF